MADVKISALPAATTPLGGTEVLPIVQSGSTVKVSVADVTAGRAVSASSLTTTGDVGVGTTAVQQNGRTIQVDGGAGAADYRLTNNATGSAKDNGGLYSLIGVDNYLWNLEAGFLSFGTDNAERGRITSAGNFGLGTAAPGSKFEVVGSSGSQQVAYFVNDSAGSELAGIASSIESGGNNTNSFHFLGVTQTVGLFYLFGNGTTSYTSDIRVKKNVETARDGYLDDVCNLRVVKYNWYNDSDDTPREIGLIAQEVEEVFPGLVQDAMHPTKDGICHKVLKGSVLTPILLKALQEANEKIDALAARVAELEK